VPRYQSDSFEDYFRFVARKLVTEDSCSDIRATLKRNLCDTLVVEEFEAASLPKQPETPSDTLKHFTSEQLLFDNRKPAISLLVFLLSPCVQLTCINYIYKSLYKSDLHTNKE